MGDSTIHDVDEGKFEKTDVAYFIGAKVAKLEMNDKFKQYVNNKK